MSDPTFIRAWQRLSDRVTTSGMPQPGELRFLADVGVRRVIDLTPHDHPEAMADEEQLLGELGIEYVQVPVPFDEANDFYYSRFVEMLEASNVPTHLHCVANHRVSCFFYRYHLERGMAEPDARQLMRAHWEPDASDHPVAAPWKAFVEEAAARNAGSGQSAPQPPEQA